MGGGIGMGNTCKPMAVSFQCMTKFTTNKKKKIMVFPLFALELYYSLSVLVDCDFFSLSTNNFILLSNKFSLLLFFNILIRYFKDILGSSVDS